VVRKVDTDDFTGIERIAVHPLTPRLYTGRDSAPREQDSLLTDELQRLPSPAEALEQALALRGDAWPTRTRHSVERTFSLWLLLEDRKRLLDTATVDQLAHQISLLEYIKAKDMRRLLIADEVGLGKTIEAGLIIKWVLENNPGARVLYLAPAMLVDNVYGELKKMDVLARIDRYSAAINTVENAELRDAQVIVASIHKAAHERNIQSWCDGSGAWDLIIADECHHLSDWSNDGTSPQKQMRLVRDLVDKRMKPGGRLVLMSATPHQGNQNKFRNLLRLLSDTGYRDSTGSLASVAGRVIYRTKEDVKDWDGKPLFSKRSIKKPYYVQLGPDYHLWLAEVAAVFQDADAGPASWRKAQALQWAASSPKAGLAYLARLALRSGFDFDHDTILWEAARALLPYRHLASDSPLEAVRGLLEKQAGISQENDEADEASLDLDTESPIDRTALECALSTAIRLMGSNAMQSKLQPLLGWISDEAPAKFVVFASPIETVDEIRLGLTGLLGEAAVVTITGSLKPHERRERMQAFGGEGVRALVASKAGSEGINLQVAHRLVHFDVPWNPMEMEQRVGRVHRYGSTRTVVVDTIVVEGSREERMLRRCRARLAQIMENLFGPEAKEGSRFEEMYSRVMTQVSAEELAEIVASEGFLTSASDEKLDELVQVGFNGWKDSDNALRQGRDAAVNQIPDRGQTRATDMESLFDVVGARAESGFSHLRLVEKNGERVEETEIASVWSFPAEGANVRRVADRITSLTICGPAGFRGYIERAGLNQPAIAAKLREIVGGASLDAGRSPRAIGFFDGAGAVRLSEPEWTRWCRSASLPSANWDVGAIVLGWALRLLHRGTSTEAWTSVRVRLTSADRAASVWLSDLATADLLRLLWSQRKVQNLVLPPHKRSDVGGFRLDGIADEARLVTREVLNDTGGFAADKHDVEIVPIAALTIEPRRDPASPGTGLDPQDDVFLMLDSPYRPAADFLEKVVLALVGIPPVHSSGAVSVYVLLVAEPALLTSSDANDHRLAFGVYVGTTEQDLIARYRQHRDPAHFLRANSLTWSGVEPVGIARLDERFRSLSAADAAVLEREVATELRREGLRVLGGH
jgi:superfamily II DNA or RNA helicase